MALAKIGSALPKRTRKAAKKAPSPESAKLVDFIAFQARKRRIKEVHAATGLCVKAVENMRMGMSGASALTITKWCQNDPDFRSAYFAYCGGLLEGDPRLLAGLTMAVNSYLQRNPPGFALP